MIERLVLFGATGDLAGRYLLPALAAMQSTEWLPDSFEVIGCSRENLDEDAFRRIACERLAEYAAEIPAAGRQAFVRKLRYRPVDVTDSASVASVVEPSRGPLAAYLALPPALFAAVVKALGSVRLATGSRIALEKPFGEDLASATALNRLLREALGPAGDQTVFRVDHVLGMATVQNVLGMRFSKSIPEAVWNSDHVEQIEILWEETLALEGRAGYYDRAGALKDVVQNHVLQLLSLIAMELPSSLEAQELHDRKLEALRSIRPLTPADVATSTRRARYSAGRLATGDAVPAYAEEDGVEPKRETETFAELALELDSARWAGTGFLLRAGKALSRRRKMAIVRFRPAGDRPNELRIGVDGPDDVSLHLTGGAPDSPVPLTLSATPPEPELPAYARVLLDVLNGGNTLSIGGDEAVEAWRVVAPVLDGWANGAVPLEEYPAGSAGPPHRTGHHPPVRAIAPHWRTVR
jgi:glucose-6-phosphate 1-dehydrogenase